MRIIVDHRGQLIRAAVIDQKGRLFALHIDRSDRQSLYGGIYRGRLVRLLARRKGALIDIGTSHLVWIDQAQLHNAPRFTQDNLPPIPGSSVIIQVHREAVQNKRPVGHFDVGIVGRFIVFRPMASGVRPSYRNVPNPLPTFLISSLDHITQQGGWIVRIAGNHLATETILAEAQCLVTQWHHCLDTNLASPAQLVQPRSAPMRALLESTDETLSEVRVETPELLKEIQLWTDRWMPEVSSVVTLSHDRHHLFDVFGLEEIFMRLMSSRVPLSCGAEVVIDVTQALIAIDVNGPCDCHPLSVNLSAALEIARQIRLRNLSGMILIDFLRMRHKEDRQRVTDALKNAMATDRIRTDIYGWTNLGLLELVRVRRGYSLPELMEDVVL